METKNVTFEYYRVYTRIYDKDNNRVQIIG